MVAPQDRSAALTGVVMSARLLSTKVTIDEPVHAKTNK